MALSNTAADTAHSESGGLTKRKCRSPISSGVTANNSVALEESRLAVSEERRPMNLELHKFPKTPVREGAKEATTHDFLSLYKNAAVTGNIEVAAAQGMVPPSPIHNFLHPLEKCAQPIGGNIITAGLLPANGQMCRVTNAGCYGGVQGASYGHSSGTIELTTKSMWTDGLERGLKGVKERLDDHADWSTSQLKFGSLELGHVAKTGSTHSQLEVGQHHTSSLNKQWQNLGSDLCSMMKEPHKVTSKANKDEENSEYNNESEENDVLNPKGNGLPKMDGKNNDCKASTPRSKHSATEQRRRSKINDRFQMLRQLVPNTDQKRDKASFLLEVIEYIQVLQEKLRNYEATEHGRKQERLKTITRDLPQRSSGLQDFVPIVSTVSSDWQKPTDSFLGRPRSTSVPAADEYGSNGHVSLPVDKAIEDSQYGPPNHEKGATSKSTPPSLSVQLPAYIPFGRDSNLPNISVLRSLTETHMLSHPVPDDETHLPISINGVEALLPMRYENSRPPRRLCDMDDKQKHELKEREYGFSQHDANSETCSKNLANGKGNPGVEVEPSVAGLLQNKDACVSKQCGGLKNAFVHTPEALQAGITSTSPLKPVFVQGDNVKMSSVYSQKLLDILTREFQCSGCDLSKTSISVQINLGKAAIQSTDIQQQFSGHGKHPAPQGQEDFNKRPKIFSKS